MIKYLVILTLGGSLYFLNPTLEQFESTVDKITESKEGVLRSGWNVLATVTGINAVAGLVGAGTYEVCRVNLYIGSLFTVKTGDSKKDPVVGVGAGGLGKIVVKKFSTNSEENSFLTSAISTVLDVVPAKECTSIHKDGAVAH